MVSTAETVNTEAVVNGQTIYTATTTYRNPQTGAVVDTQSVSYVIEQKSQLEKVDEGFITHTTAYYRDAATGELLDADTTSLIKKTTSQTFKTAGRGAGGTAETVQIDKTTYTDADTNKIVSTQNTYTEINRPNATQLSVIENITNFATDGTKTTAINKYLIDNPNYQPPIKNIAAAISTVTPFSKTNGDSCELDTECSSGSCGKQNMMSLKGSCQVNTTPAPVVDPSSCAAGTTLTCRGGSCVCLTSDQNTSLTTLEKAVPASNGLTGAAFTPELASMINPERTYAKTNLNNYAICGGDEACNTSLTSAETGLSILPGFDRYVEAFAPDKASKAWQYTGYSSLEACQEGKSRSAAMLCNMPTRSVEQLSASTQLGTSVTAAGAAVSALPTMIFPAVTATTGILAGGGAAITSTLASVGAISTMYQTGNATVTCLDGSENCTRDALYAGLSWANLGTMQYVSSAFASGVTSQMQVARYLNTAVSVANAATDLDQAKEGCLGENATTANCIMSAGAFAFDIVGGVFDYRSGQFLYSKLPTVDVPPATLLHVAGTEVDAALPTPALANVADLPELPITPALTSGAVAPVIDLPPRILTESLGDLNAAYTNNDLRLGTNSDAANLNAVEAAWDQASVGRSSNKITRVETVAIVDPVVKAKAEAFNGILDEFEKSVGYHLYEEQVQTLLSSDPIAQLKTANGGSLAGKSDAITRILSVTEPKSMALFKGSTEAIEYVNSQMLTSGGIQFFGSQNTKGIFIDSQRGFLEIDFSKGNFDPNFARRMSADEVAGLLKANTDLPGSTHISFVADRPNAVWTRLAGNEAPDSTWLSRLMGKGKPTAEGLLMKQITQGEQGKFIYIIDEISDGIKKNMAMGGSGIDLSKIKNPKLLGGLKNGNEAINTYRSVDASSTHQGFFSQIINKLSLGQDHRALLVSVGDGNYVPRDISIQGNSLADVIDQSLLKTKSRTTDLGKKLDSLIEKLRRPATNDLEIKQLEDTIKELDALIATSQSSTIKKELTLITDLNFRKATLQDDWNQFARRPGTDFAQEDRDLVLYEGSASTGERLPETTQLLSFYDKGSKMLAAASQNMLGGKIVDITILPDLTQIKIAPPGTQMNVMDFYDEVTNARLDEFGNLKNTVKGLDATPQEALNLLNQNQKVNAESLRPTNFGASTTREGLADQLMDNRQTKYNNM
jgi:hypothetical protein